MNKLVISDLISCNVDGNCPGHYVSVADMYLSLFRSESDVVIAGGPVYNRYFSPEVLDVLPYDDLERFGYIRNRIRSLLNARRLFRSCSSDTIVIQDGKPITNHIGIALFHHKKNRVFLIKYNTNGLNSCAGRILWKMIKHKVSGVICPNEDVGKAYHVPYCIVPDYIHVDDEHLHVQQEKKLYDFSIVGFLNEDKGVCETAQMLADSKYKLLIAGKATPEYAGRLQSICSKCDNIELKLGYISNEEFDGYINASRYALLNYKGEYSNHSSGVVFDYIFRRVPVIGQQCRALSFVDEYSIGCLYSNLSMEALNDATAIGKYDSYMNNIDTYLQNNSLSRKALLEFLYY